MTDTSINVSFDEPLQPGSAISNDKLHRTPFAQTVVEALLNVHSQAGLVVSIEGSWGTGKTSTLAMIEELLSKRTESERPVIVRFNPWLVGERDVLLSQFFTQMASAIKLTDQAKEGRRVAKEVLAYAKVFDVLRLIPAAEPWASIVKSVFEAVGGATNSILEHKQRDLEAQKRRLEKALQEYSRRVVVIIDDIDRLFPNEVYEILRIVKAVGHLPKVGYVVAWDPNYIANALSNLGVPNTPTYLEKIVQVRLALPDASSPSRLKLLYHELATFPKEALTPYFVNAEERVHECFQLGLRSLIRNLRDLKRVFNVARVLEIQLRGEVVLADILALAAISVKGGPVFEKLRLSPEWFVGVVPGTQGIQFEKEEEAVQKGSDERDAAYQRTENPEAVRRLVHFLFPLVAGIEDGYSSPSHSDADGRVANPGRLLIALQQGLADEGVSAALARSFLVDSASRANIEHLLTEQNCLEFLELLGDTLESGGYESITDSVSLAVAIANLVDTSPFFTRSWGQVGLFAPSVDRAALGVIESLGEKVGAESSAAMAVAIAQSPECLSMAAALILRSRATKRGKVSIPADALERTAEIFGSNVLNAATAGNLFSTGAPREILRAVVRHTPALGPAIFARIRDDDAALDTFAQTALLYSVGSKGATFRLPENREDLTAYCPLEEFRALGEKRLTVAELSPPARSAWRAAVEDKCLHAIDGTEDD